MRPRLALPVAALCLSAVALVGCGSSSTPTNTSSAGPQVITVAYKAGKIVPAEHKVTVKLGSRVEIRVTSDVAEIVHNHFNNAEQDVAAGGTVVFDFTADKPGGYEVELHKSDKLLLELEVQ